MGKLRYGFSKVIPLLHKVSHFLIKGFSLGSLNNPSVESHTGDFTQVQARISLAVLCVRLP